MPTILKGWKNYVEISIPASELSGDLTWFPVMVKLSSSSGINGKDLRRIITELGANWNKIAFTTKTGRQLFYEKELWNTTNVEAVFWVSKQGLVLDSTNGTKLYLYWDGEQVDNTAYGGVSGSTPAEKVWDANFKLVSHMDDNPNTSSVMDSTSNDNDGAKKAANEPLETTGKIGKGQLNEPTDDYINVAHAASLNISAAITLECWLNPVDLDDFYVAMAKGVNEAYEILIENVSGHIYPLFKITGAVHQDMQSVNGLTAGAWNYVALTYDGTTFLTYLNAGLEKTTVHAGTIDLTGASLMFGARKIDVPELFFDGSEDEFRVSSSKREPAWITASYETKRDHFINYGDLERVEATFGTPVPRPEVPLSFIKLLKKKVDGNSVN